MTLERFMITQNVIGFPVTAERFESQVSYIVKWAKAGLSRMVCVANVHMLTEASWDPQLARVLQNSDMVTPDGMPLVWMLRLLRRSSQDRVAGMDLMLSVCDRAVAEGISVFFVGSDEPTLAKMRVQLQQDFPTLKIAGMEPLPFGAIPLPSEQEEPVLQKIRSSKAGVVFVSLGCPKQEFWMAQHRSHLSAVLVGVGGVFPVYAGVYKRAPRVIRESGLEWLYRLFQEPRRLWKRYSRTIPPFLWLALKQLWQERDRSTQEPMVTGVMVLGQDEPRSTQEPSVTSGPADKWPSTDRN